MVNKGILLIGGGILGLVLLSGKSNADDPFLVGSGSSGSSGSSDQGFGLGNLVDSFLAGSNAVSPFKDNAPLDREVVLSKKSTGETIGTFSQSQINSLDSGNKVFSNGSVFGIETFNQGIQDTQLIKVTGSNGSISKKSNKSTPKVTGGGAYDKLNKAYKKSGGSGKIKDYF